ncbi:MAG: 2,3,4,5-tetrahydropyridine-2,6-dicarboxylate N-succinyltransferase [Acidimicrobiales bacterium]
MIPVSESEALASEIEGLYERRGELSIADSEANASVSAAIDLLDRGLLRVATQQADGTVVVHEWLKKAILLLFRLRAVESVESGPFEFADRIPLKRDFAANGVRVVPGASARWGSYLAAGVVLMPSYVNIGAHVGQDTMVDTWATVGSCAQIGARVHLSGGVGIGGVLEPPNAVPVIIGDDANIGSRSMITQGAQVGAGSVLSEGTVLNPGIPVIDSETGEELSRGVVPPWCVAIGAHRRREYPGGEFFLPCVLVIRHLKEGERASSAQLNEILRDHGARS